MNQSRMGLLAALAASAVLAACTTPNLYKPSGEKNTIYGYTDNKVEANLYRVTYTAPSRMGKAYAQVYAMYRAAELSQASGATHFEVLEGGLSREILQEFPKLLPPPAGTEEKKVSNFSDDKQRPVYTANAFSITRQLADGSQRPLYMGDQKPLMPNQEVARRYVPTYIYIPAVPSPPPLVNVSLLVRLHATEPADYPTKLQVFSVQDVLKTFGPYIRRPDNESKA